VGGGSHAAFIARPGIAAGLILAAVKTTCRPIQALQYDPPM
jgi:hypothetical protein